MKTQTWLCAREGCGKPRLSTIVRTGELSPFCALHAAHLCRDCFRSGVKHTPRFTDLLRCEACGHLLTWQDDVERFDRVAAADKQQSSNRGR